MVIPATPQKLKEAIAVVLKAEQEVLQGKVLKGSLRKYIIKKEKKIPL